jgi:hypothetical protein
MLKSVLLVSAIELLVIAGASAQTRPPPSALQAPAGVARVLGPSNSPYTAATAKDFAEACKQDQSSCSSMVGQVLMDRIQFSPTSHICLPGINYASAVGPWLDARPDATNMNARDGIYLALTTIYKCGSSNNS